MVSLIYGAITVIVCGLAIWRGRNGTDWIGGITFVGWLYYQAVSHRLTFTAEQGWLSVGDLAQGSAILFLMFRAHRGRNAIALMTVIFGVMIGLHLLPFMVADPSKLHYHTLLNYAYIAQLATLGGMVWRDERSRIAPDDHRGLSGVIPAGRGASR